MPRPSSSTEHPPRAKSTAASILVAFASREFFRSSSTTPVSETIAVDDLIWAITSAGRGRIDRLEALGIVCLAPMDVFRVMT
jgi:hypothetical protein